MVSTFHYVRKHAFMLKRYLAISLVNFSEYKIVFYANMIQYIVLGAVWIIFWNLLLGKIEAIAHWKLPMLIMLTGFVYFNQAINDLFWQTFRLDSVITKGEIEKYLVRPVDTLYAITIGKINIADLLPAMIGLGIIVFALVKYYEFMMVKFFLGLLAGVIGVAIIQTIMCIIGTFGFWIGRVASIRMVMRSFKMTERYPMDLYSLSMRAFFTFVMPFIFIGTFPVLMLTQYSIGQGLTILLIELLVFIFWFGVLMILWKRGVQRYESVGG